MKVYVALSFGDIAHHPPECAFELETVLLKLQEKYGYGKAQSYELDGQHYVTPDPEDDKIEVWEFDAENNTSKIVWGFYGWHWVLREDVGQGTMPGNMKTLYQLAMEDY